VRASGAAPVGELPASLRECAGACWENQTKAAEWGMPCHSMQYVSRNVVVDTWHTLGSNVRQAKVSRQAQAAQIFPLFRSSFLYSSHLLSWLLLVRAGALFLLALGSWLLAVMLCGGGRRVVVVVVSRGWRLGAAC
jgi:hypothetical protein